MYGSTAAAGFLSNRDFDFFYQGLAQSKLLVQKCASCGVLRNPPSPMCGACRSTEVQHHECRGGGVVFSYTVHHHPPLNGFPVPHAMALVELDEGVRMFGSLSPDVDVEKSIGRRVRVEFLRRGEVATFRFVPEG
jgi:uncharacterized OB-fold protein